jgi:hypothetical protein
VIMTLLAMLEMPHDVSEPRKSRSCIAMAVKFS